MPTRQRLDALHEGYAWMNSDHQLPQYLKSHTASPKALGRTGREPEEDEE